MIYIIVDLLVIQVEFAFIALLEVLTVQNS